MMEIQKLINTLTKPLNEEIISFLNKKSKITVHLKIQFSSLTRKIPPTNSNEFIKEFVLDSLELVSRSNEINKLNQKLNDLESLSKEKLI